MKFGFFTDLHARGDSPEGRTDDFSRSVLTKLEEIGDIFKKAKVDLILFGADLFDTYDPAKSVIADVGKILRSWNLPIVSVIGSHDYCGYQVKSLRRTAVGLLAATTDYLTLIGAPGLPQFYDTGDVRIYGNSHSHDLISCSDAFYYLKPEYIKYQMQMIHADVIDQHVIWNHILCKDVSTESDLVLIGHYHSGWTTPYIVDKERKDYYLPLVQGSESYLLPENCTTYINPGSIGRMSNTGKQRVPKVLLIETPVKEHALASVTYVPLVTALAHPFKDKLKVAEEESVDIHNLLSMLSSPSMEAVDFKAVLAATARQLNYSAAVIEKAFEIIERV